MSLLGKMYLFEQFFFCWGGNDKERSQSAVGELENVKWVLNKKLWGVKMCVIKISKK